MHQNKVKNAFLIGKKGDHSCSKQLLNLTLDEFLNDAQKYFRFSKPESIATTFEIDKYPLLPGQASYVMDYTLNELSYKKGLEELLGYNDEECTMHLLLNYFHPTQYNLVQRIIKGAINYGLTQSREQELNTWLFITFKAKKKDGTYITLLRQTSVYEKDKRGGMISSFSILSDLTGMTNSNKVEWKLKGPKVDEDRFRNYVYKALDDFFSAREKEIIQLIQDGKSSKEIAALLFISKNTVDTHRRNMLRKSGCFNATELVKFAQDNAII